MKLGKVKLSLALCMAAAVLVTGCGSTSSSETTAQSETTEAAETTEEDTTGESSVTYPITITHALGETVIESEPQRVATIGWGNQDVPLALGIVPVGVSEANFGPVNEQGLLPWTAEAFAELGEENPVVFNDTDGLDYEAISDVDPDVILAAYSGITEEEYELLSQIAPVVAYPEYPWQTYWREQVLLNATALGKEEEANQMIADTEELISSKLEEYPDLEDKTAAFFYFTASDLGTFYVYLPTDPRASYLPDLGLAFPEEVLALADDPSAFSLTMSSENIESLENIDIIITYGDDAVLEVLQNDALVGKIPAIANGAVVMLDESEELSAATTPSILSIPATLDEYLSRLNEAAQKVK
ncbi:MAG: iron-siderophore ABC transporter substrate-binding protein [Lachnospiraceae bacterium]